MSLDVTLTQHKLTEVFSSNITHNLGKMAKEAGIYEALWRPEEIGIVYAKQLIEPLTAGLEKMKSDPSFYKAYEPENKWGRYQDFVPWIEEYLSACNQFPEAEINISR